MGNCSPSKQLNSVRTNNKKAEAPWSAPTSIRRALQEGVLYFRKGLAYDLEGLGAAAGLI
ncbi:hypothetical protein HUN92_15220 [Bacillus firmus]|uniref:hypothetical protein n=1 Tax=Cytobacillus firmus TaxID=1399 RepID=UPI0015804C86|nr:hypothetical protein [Cytobacillus firmus]NUH85065.1 hypothetical protein [Cytobacillus firmus]